MSKFNNIPRDNETNIFYSSVMKWDDLDITYERWGWDNIIGESIIFHNTDIEELNDKKLEADVRSSAVVEPDSEITIKKGEVFTFVNFNFRIL